MSKISDEKSLQQLAMNFVEKRNDETFTLLYERFKPGLKKYIKNFSMDSDTVDDIFSVTMSKAYSFVDKYDSTWNFSTWVYTICRNECLAEIKRKSMICSFDGTNVDFASNSEDMIFENDYEFFSNEETIQSDDVYDEILNEIKNLPEHYRGVISDRIINKMKYKDISIKYGLKINTVRSRIHSAKKILKSIWLNNKTKSENSTKIINIPGITSVVVYGEKKFEKCDIIVISAVYGARDKWIDVTEEVKEKIESEGEVKSCNRLGGDPIYGVKKSMIIKYEIGSQEIEKKIPEGKLFVKQNCFFQ